MRAKRRKKLTGDYIQQSLDYFEMLLSHLRINSEVVLKRERISEISEGLWSESSITKFFQHLTRTNILDCQNRGASGLGITLLKDLTESPWKNRQSETGEVSPEVGIPEDEDYTATVDLDLAIEAIDTVAGLLGSIEMPDHPTATPAWQEPHPARLERAIENLSKIRAALVTGNDAGLSEVVNEDPVRPRRFYRRPEQP
jgi:hypothetical protein